MSLARQRWRCVRNADMCRAGPKEVMQQAKASESHNAAPAKVVQEGHGVQQAGGRKPALAAAGSPRLERRGPGRPDGSASGASAGASGCDSSSGCAAAGLARPR